MPRLICPLARRVPGRIFRTQPVSPIDDPAARYVSTLPQCREKEQRLLGRVGVETEALGSQRRELTVRRFVPCRTVVLVGLMGAGKTKIGRRLAVRLGLPFFDSDQEIEAAAGETIEEIFANRGERVFREGERRVIARLLARPAHVLATGGGAFMDPLTRTVVRCRGVSLWLRADLDVLVQRVSRRSDRPLLNAGDPRAILAQLIERRHPIYGEADLTIDSGDGSPEATVNRAIAALNACSLALTLPETECNE
ncbi:MAG TPA: shikimate kinase [Stellaceae bacterium]|nr:shikimate kinase [Stellaceae bacterium]